MDLMGVVTIGLFILSLTASYLITAKGMKNPRHLLVISLTIVVLLLVFWATTLPSDDPELRRKMYFD